MSARQIGTALWRVTGRRRPPPLPEPLEIAPRTDTPAPLEAEGTSLYRPPAERETPLAPCGQIGGHLLTGDGSCWYGCQEVDG